MFTSCIRPEKGARIDSLRSPMSYDFNSKQESRKTQEPDPSHRYDPVEALLRLKSLKQHGVERSHLDPFAMDILHRPVEVHTFPIPHDHIPRSNHEKEEGAQSHRCEVSSVSHTGGED